MKHPHNIFLEQHTPIIHFQSDQTGATLRATELKSKLDRFIITKKAGKVPDAWLQTNEKPGQIALRYKVKISPAKQPVPRSIPPKHLCFFGNINRAAPYMFTETNEEIVVSIFSFQEDLKEFIYDHHHEFFAYHNFGSRQSKGFGCFLPKDMSIFPTKFYHFDVHSKDTEVVFASIDLLYKTLRGGINGIAHPNPKEDKHKGFVEKFYMKPMVFQYAADGKNKIRWEKRAIKEEYFTKIKEKNSERNGKLKNQLEEHIYDKNHEPSPLFYEEGTPKIVRDWLGLSTDQEWKDYPEKGKSITIKKIHVDSEGTEVNKDKAIVRMKSPLLFKPRKTEKGYRVYFCAVHDDEVKKEFKQSRFKIKAGSGDTLKLGVWTDFDLDKFLEFAFEKGRIESSIVPPMYDKEKAEAIKTEIIRIYNDIRNSKPNAKK